MQLVRGEEAAKHPSRYLDGYPEMLMDEDVAVVTEADYERLSEYSTSIPTGVCDGKVWRRDWSVNGGKGEAILFFEADPDDPGQCFIRQRRLIKVGTPEFWDWLVPGIWNG